MCMEGDVTGLQDAFSSGTLSPFAVTERGDSLLSLAACSLNPGLCSMLIRLGVDPNHTNMRRMSVLEKLCFWLRCNDVTVKPGLLDTMRILIKSQRYVTFWQLGLFCYFYIGPQEGADLMISGFLTNGETPHTRDPNRQHDSRHIALHMALYRFGRQPGTWKDLVRKLLWRKMPREYDGYMHWQTKSTWDWFKSTALDMLVRSIEHPFDLDGAADAWLQLLVEEGYDIVSYLQEEIKLHSELQQYNPAFHPVRQVLDGSQRFSGISYKLPRVLIFKLDPPSLTWDWYIDPTSSAYQALTIFRYFNVDYDLKSVRGTPIARRWTLWWPLDYPLWFPEYSHWPHREPVTVWSELGAQANRRANRRVERKAQKLARVQERRGFRHMPGAWVA